MNFFVYIFLLSFLLILLNGYLIRSDYLVSETGDNHQKFASKFKTPLTGGIFFFLSILFFYEELGINFLLFSILILILGIISDLKLIVSAKKRLIFQILIVLSFIILNDIQITNTRIDLLDKLISYKYLNYFFVCFCILIVINGSNFFDGLNTLSSGYYLLITLIMIYINLIDNLVFQELFLKNIFLVLFIIFVYNFCNKIFIGDSGSYLLGFVFSILLINFYNNNQQLSPFYIILLLWYPAFETLFSMIRKNILNRSPMRPDSNHLHQLIFYYIRKKYFKKILVANLVSANIINMYNLIIFLVATQFLFNTQVQLILILLNLLIYTVIYFKLFLYKYNKI